MHVFIDKIYGLLSYKTLKLVLASFGTMIMAVVGDTEFALQIVVILVFIDGLSGFACGWKEENISSKRFARTLYKLLLYFALIIATHQVTRYAGYMKWVEDFTVLYLSITELISLFENAARLGVPMPPWVLKKLRKYLEEPK